VNALVVEDARKYVFPVFSARAQDNGVLLESRRFLGTGFFVTKRGDAITANHVIPTPDALEEGRRLIAIVQVDGEAKVCWITRAAKFELFDIVLFHVNLSQTKCLNTASGVGSRYSSDWNSQPRNLGFGEGDASSEGTRHALRQALSRLLKNSIYDAR
jgi:hypothetical protein